MPQHPKQRDQQLAKQFIQDYEEAIHEYKLPLQLEITEHLLEVLNILEAYAVAEKETVYKRFITLTDALLKKHRRVLAPFINKQFHVYFMLDTVLYEKKVLSAEAFNRLTAAAQRLSPLEIANFILICRNVLGNGRQYMYLRMEPETALTENETTIAALEIHDEPDGAITKARQLLALYYLFNEVFKIGHRTTHSVSNVVRLLHLLTGTKFTQLQNSDLYKKYLRMPNYNSDERLIKDLQFIRPYFEDLELKDALTKIDQEIEKCIRELPYATRKKYRQEE